MISTSHERKTIAVNKDIAEKLTDIARHEGMTLFSLINEILETAIQAHESKLGKYQEIISKYQGFMIAKDIGMSFTPLKLINLVFKFAFQTEGKDKLLEEWYNFGKWVKNYTTARFPNQELETIEHVSKTIFWMNTEIKIDKIPNNKNPNEIELRIFGRDLDIEYLECISRAYEGMFHEFGYKTMKKDISTGICLIKLKK